jgi:hypothetical protein
MLQTEEGPARRQDRRHPQVLTVQIQIVWEGHAAGSTFFKAKIRFLVGRCVVSFFATVGGALKPKSFLCDSHCDDRTPRMD